MNYMRRVLRHWYTLGYPEFDQVKYMRRLASDNLDMVRRVCIFCQPFLVVMCVLRNLMVGLSWGNIMPFVAACVVITAILMVNNRVIGKGNVLFHSYTQTALFSMVVIVLPGYYDFVVESGSVCVMTCVAILVVGSLFDSRPLDILLAYLLYLVALYSVMRCTNDPLIITNMFDLAVSAILGTCVAWYKSRTHFGQMLANEKELKALQHAARVQIMVSQINPHFVCNVLATVQAMCDTDTAKAKEALGVFSAYMRDNTDAVARTEPIPFSMELQHVKRYVSLEQMRFGDKLVVLYDIKTTNFRVPALSVQPIVENAIKHGIGNKAEGGVVTLSTRERQEMAYVEISDNGVGMDEDKLNSLTGDIAQTIEGFDNMEGDGRCHVGLANVRERLRLMSHGTVAISSQPGKGTKITISIPKNPGSVSE